MDDIQNTEESMRKTIPKSLEDIANVIILRRFENIKASIITNAKKIDNIT